jgi:O-antigen/teichoic acid export membrane protein
VKTAPEVRTAAPPDGLGRRATRALGWSFLNTAVSRLGTIGIGIFLARLLGPTEFGAFAVATVALLAVLSFNELGVSLAIVRWRTDPAAIAPTVATISVGMSVLLFGALCLAAGPLAAVMGEPEAAPVVRVMALAVILNGLVATPAALLQREFQQRRRMAVDQINTWLGAAVSLALALLGMGAMSLAVGRIAGSAASAVLYLRWSPLPYRFGFDRKCARSLMRFGLPLAGASLVVFAVGYADQIIAGSTLGATVLGFYVLAFNLSCWPVSLFSQPLRSVAPAALARLQGDQLMLQRSFTGIVRLLLAVSLPACLLLAGAAAPVVTLVYGRAWGPAATALTFLSLAAASRILFEVSYDLLVVVGQTRGILVVQCLWLVLLVPALIVGARWDGLRGIAIAQAATATLLVLPAYAYLLQRAGMSVIALLSAAWPAAAASVGVGGFAYAISGIVPSALTACVVAGLAALVACAALLAGSRGLIRELRTTGDVRTA